MLPAGGDVEHREVVLPGLPPTPHRINQDNHGFGHALVLSQGELSVGNEPPIRPTKEKKVPKTEPICVF